MPDPIQNDEEEMAKEITPPPEEELLEEELPPAVPPVIPLEEIGKWGQEPAATFEPRLPSLEDAADEDIDEDIVDVEENLAKGNRNAEEKEESLGEDFKKEIDKEISASSDK